MLLGDCNGRLCLGTASMLRPGRSKKCPIKTKTAATWQRRGQCKNQLLVATGTRLEVKPLTKLEAVVAVCSLDP